MEFDSEEKTIEPGTVIDLPQSFIVLSVPDDTVEVDITAKVYVNSELHTVTRHMDFPEVREAIRDGSRNYLPDDTLFVLAPTRREKMAELLEKYAFDDEDE